jgi:hypothetical protein
MELHHQATPAIIVAVIVRSVLNFSREEIASWAAAPAVSKRRFFTLRRPSAMLTWLDYLRNQPAPPLFQGRRVAGAALGPGLRVLGAPIALSPAGLGLCSGPCRRERKRSSQCAQRADPGAPLNNRGQGID